MCEAVLTACQELHEYLYVRCAVLCGAKTKITKPQPTKQIAQRWVNGERAYTLLGDCPGVSNCYARQHRGTNRRKQTADLARAEDPSHHQETLLGTLII